MPDATSPSSTQSTEISERFARIAVAVERYFLPWIYIWFVYHQANFVHASYLKYHAPLRAGIPHMSAPLFWASMTKSGLLAVLSLFTMFMLLLNRRPTHLPRNLAHITVPLAMSFYLFLYGTVNLMPLDLREDLVPFAWRPLAAIAAVVVSAIGYAITIWGLCSLGRSFAIFVAVRRVVNGGPYQYVRHPMYLGYLFELAGLLLASFSPGMLLLGAGFIFLMVTRARLEEKSLVEADPAYREYMRHTGFLFPRFGAKPAPAP